MGALRNRGVVEHWLVLLVFWVILSGHLDAFHIGLGVVVSLAVALLARDLQQVSGRRQGRLSLHLYETPGHRILVYFIWLLRQIWIANWQVVRIVLDPKLPIAPTVLRYRTHLDSDVARTVLANSITLTPGTITLEVEDDELLVHALIGDEGVAQGIADMDRHIGRALRELPESRGGI